MCVTLIVVLTVLTTVFKTLSEFLTPSKGLVHAFGEVMIGKLESGSLILLISFENSALPLSSPRIKIHLLRRYSLFLYSYYSFEPFNKSILA